MICIAGAETEAAWYGPPGAPDDCEQRVSSGVQTAARKRPPPAIMHTGMPPELQAYLVGVRQRVLGRTGRPLAEGRRPPPMSPRWCAALRAETRGSGRL